MLERVFCAPENGDSGNRKETIKNRTVANLLCTVEPMLLIERSRPTSRTTGLRYIYESQEGQIMLILWKVTQGKPPG